MTIHINVATKKYLVRLEKHEDICIYHISQLPEPPPRGACLLQDYWYTAQKPPEYEDEIS
jgi:hypothetical protein